MHIIAQVMTCYNIKPDSDSNAYCYVNRIILGSSTTFPIIVLWMNLSKWPNTSNLNILTWQSWLEDQITMHKKQIQNIKQEAHSKHLIRELKDTNLHIFQKEMHRTAYTPKPGPTGKSIQLKSLEASGPSCPALLPHPSSKAVLWALLNQQDWAGSLAKGFHVPQQENSNPQAIRESWWCLRAFSWTLNVMEKSVTRLSNISTATMVS